MNTPQNKVLILNPNAPPRAIRFLNLLAKKSIFDYHVFFYSVSSKNRRWNLDKNKIMFKYKILKSFEIGFGTKDYFPFIVSLDFLYELLKLEPKVIVVPGWADLPSYISALYCLCTRCKLILRSESTEHEKSLRRTLFKPVTKFMVKSASAYIASGTRAKRYLMSLGASPKRIFVGYSPIDVDYFRKKSALSSAEKANVKSKMGIISKSKVVLFVGQLIVRKGVYDLVSAFASITPDNPNAVLVFIGYGQELEGLKYRVRELNIQDKIFFIDFVSNEKLPYYFAASDVFVLPSHEETWGIVVNEAMACGLPVIVNSLVGSSCDLIKNNQNGFVYSSKTSISLTKAIRILLNDDHRRKLMGSRGREISRKFGFDQLGRAFNRSVSYSLTT